MLLLGLPLCVMAAELTPCPDKPNCVSSQAQGRDHYIEALRYTGEMAAARDKLLAVLAHQPRTELTGHEENTLHVTFTSLLFRFVDDVQFLFDDEHKLIHVRSASRSGYYDFGVNRRRVEGLRKAFQAE